MRAIGLHLRVETSLRDVALRAQSMGLPIFQCFLTSQTNYATLVPFDDEVINEFRRLREQYFQAVYIHGSYGTNLAGVDKGGMRLLRQEIDLAQRLSCSHIILHPGSAVGGKSRMDGIDALVRRVNAITRTQHDIIVTLENTTHAKFTVGSDLVDFYHIRQKLEYPERVAFCIDTAHAYSYGYNIAQAEGREKFMALIDEMIGFDRIAVLHLNDAQDKCCSRIDKHAVIGCGSIGEPALKAFALDNRLAHIPIILELPLLAASEERAAVDLVRSWYE